MSSLACLFGFDDNVLCFLFYYYYFLAIHWITRSRCMHEKYCSIFIASIVQTVAIVV